MTNREGLPIPQKHLDIFQDQAFNHRADISTYTQELRDRIHIETQLAEVYRATNKNRWSFESGDYRTNRYPRGLDAPLQDLEVQWDFSIGAHESRSTLWNPMVAMDLGAGFALSLIRLGAIRRFEKRIEEGRLILAATNLGYLPPTEPDEDGYTGVARSMNELSKSGANTRRTEKELAFVEKHQNKVQFLDNSLLELPHEWITTRDGSEMPLYGNVGMISERLALVHSQVPEVGIGAISDLLMPGGHLYLDTTDPRAIEPSTALKQVTMPDGRVIDMQGGYVYHEQRKRALQIGLASAAPLGLQYVGKVGNDGFSFFKKTNT